MFMGVFITLTVLLLLYSTVELYEIYRGNGKFPFWDTHRLSGAILLILVVPASVFFLGLHGISTIIFSIIYAVIYISVYIIVYSRIKNKGDK